MAVPLLGPAEVRAALLSPGEVALVDVREQHPFAGGHILLAVHVALSRLELDLPRLVPCRKARLILCDGGEGLAHRAADVAAVLGYTDIAILDGGTPAWQATGYRLFTGLNATGAALAETVDLVCRPPQMEATELARRRASGEAMVVLDSRPWEGYLDHHVPGAIACPGGELVYRIPTLVPHPDTTVVVNCAGRSRSIFGAQSLINAGLANPVYALAQGTHGWALAGLELAHGEGPRADGTPGGKADWQLREASMTLARACGVRIIDGETLRDWCRERDEHTLYLLDVRSPEEYAAGHVPGALCAPGGQLVECADDWIGVRGGRLVLLDDDGVRAPMAASWMRQLGYPIVAVLADPADTDGASATPCRTIPPMRAVAVLGAGAVQPGDVLLDLSPGTSFMRCHVQGALWALRARLGDVLDELPVGRLVVMDDAGGILASRAVTELHAAGRSEACCLPGGLEALRAAGHVLASGSEGMLHAMDDCHFLPADMVEDRMAEAADYLAWQADLVRQVAEDGLLAFAPYRPPAVARQSDPATIA